MSDFVEPIKMKTMDELWVSEIEKRMQIFRGNKTQVADSLGITKKTLYNRLHQFGLMECYRKNKRNTEVSNEQDKGVSGDYLPRIYSNLGDGE